MLALAFIRFFGLCSHRDAIESRIVSMPVLIRAIDKSIDEAMHALSNSFYFQPEGCMYVAYELKRKTGCRIDIQYCSHRAQDSVRGRSSFTSLHVAL